MKKTGSVPTSIRLPMGSMKRLKRMASSHGWTASEVSSRLVEEGLRRADFAFIDFRDSSAGRQAYLQGSSLAVWEVMMVARDYKNDVAAAAKHLRWPPVKVQAAINYASAFPDEVESSMAENDATEFKTLLRMLPQATEFVASGAKRS
jgi:hypothetical protein